MANDNDEVGYRKPPRDTRFKPGQSGNPKGRPKGVKNLATDLQEELEQKITVTEANQTLQVTKQRAMLKTLFAKALKGDARSANVLINLILGLEESKESEKDVQALSYEDMELLQAYREKLLGEIKTSDTGDKT